MPYFQIWRDTAGYFRLTLRGGNNEIIFTTEGYARKESAMNALRVVQSTNASTRIVDQT